MKQAWEQASSTGFGDYLNTIKSAQITDKKGVLIDLTQKDWSNLTKDVQAKIQALDPSHYDTFLAIQKHAVHDSLTTAYTIMFAFCALAYLIAWSVMKALVPKEKIINL